ncbi:MAG TPA: hypothetical protein VFI34_03120 [Candidatus Limnocylindrales bacterium]|nr:hypothetical protein [Candidatus Limnocylindrales bacterium]
MTNLDDFDRSLGEFLRDGPTVAPEPPVIAALAHARATPRRRDPLAALRRDVMAGPRTIVGLRPGVLLAGAALLIAAIGLAIIGSGGNPEPSPSLRPSTGPSSLPPAAFARDVSLIVTAGQPLTVHVTDTSGFLLDATSGQPGDGASVGENDVRFSVDPAADRNAMLVTWIGLGCETTGGVLVDVADKIVTITRESCSGDTLPLDRVLRLRFAGPVQPAAWHGFVGGGVASPVASAPVVQPSSAADATVSLRQTGGNPAWIDIVDESGHFVEARLGRLGESEGPEFLTATNVDARTVRVTWPGSPCDTVHRLTIAADFGLTLDRPICYGDAIAAFYAIELTFDTDVDAAAMDSALRDGHVDSGLPTFVITGIDAAGGRYDLSINERSGSVTEVGDSGFDQPLEPGPANIAVEDRGPDTVRLSWRSAPCETTPALVIDPSGTRWEMQLDGCDPASPGVLRSIDVQLSSPVAADAIGLTLVTG